jgi:hemolysin-activating ACP:hemolysin acyltransferase
MWPIHRGATPPTFHIMTNADLQPPLGNADSVPAPHPRLRLFRPDNPYVALGLAVSYMMTKPAFAARHFGEWSRILVGQINRKHYYFVLDRENQVQGFVGWAVTTRAKAEAWVEGRERISHKDSFKGDSLLINAWAASSLEANRFLLDAARRLFKDYDTFYFKRYYKDGRMKPRRLTMDWDQAPDGAYVAAALALYERAREQEPGQGR